MASKRSNVKSKGGKKSSHKKPVPARVKSSLKSKAKAPAKPSKPAKHAVAQVTTKAASKKVNVVTEIPETTRLLRETKSTIAALGHLEKAIKLIYHKEFKKARIELKSLLEDYPGEQEISARARTYIQICDREDASHKKPIIGNDQLYTLGVMEHNQGNFESAICYFRQSLEKHADSDYIYYSLAASFAMKGDLTEAVRNLNRAVELNEENRIFAKNDSDFVALQGQKEFSDLVGWNQSTAGGQH
jgi:tetratricopeptide (TPR) repeat protein